MRRRPPPPRERQAGAPLTALLWRPRPRRAMMTDDDANHAYGGGSDLDDA